MLEDEMSEFMKLVLKRLDSTPDDLKKIAPLVMTNMAYLTNDEKKQYKLKERAIRLEEAKITLMKHILKGQ